MIGKILLKTVNEKRHGMDKKLKKVLLNWYIDFINTDLDNLSDAEKIKLALEIGVQVGNRPFHKFGSKIGSPGDDLLEIIGPDFLKRTELHSLQKGLQYFFGTMMFNIQQALNHPYRGWTPTESTDFNPEANRFSADMDIQLVVDGFKYERKEKRNDQGEIECYYKAKEDLAKNATIALHYGSRLNKKEEILKFNFARLLEGIPLKAFCRCKEKNCENYFINISKRKKEFCSNKCAARFGVREKRRTKKKESPEEYEKELKKNAKRSRKSYEKKIRKKHPKAIPERRPYKHNPG